MTRNRIISWLLASTLITVIASISLNVFLFQVGRQYYLDLNQTRLDPLGMAKYPTGAAQPDASDKPTLVFVGDSRAFDWLDPADASNWNIINRGIGAQTTAQVLGRFDQQVAPLHPKVIVLEVGINDLKTIPLFPDQKQSIIQQRTDYSRDELHLNAAGFHALNQRLAEILAKLAQ